jgi:hypothetical protein
MFETMVVWCCDGVVLWWCCAVVVLCWSAGVLGQPNFTNSALFKLISVCCCLDTTIHAFDE